MTDIFSFDAGNAAAEAAIAAFREEAIRGLRSEADGLPMIPALRLSAQRLQPCRCVLVDIGGTTLKSAVAETGPEGVVLSALREGPVPGRSGPISEADFFAEVCAFAGIGPDTERLAVSFSHGMLVLPGLDGRISGWCKEIRVTESGGLSLKALFRRAAGNPSLEVRVTNDSVASLLGAVGEVRPDDTVLGLVNGTGFNICWRSPEGLVYNTEAGESRAFTPGPIDVLVDRESELPGEALCEKQVSGVYLERVIAACLKEAGLAEETEGRSSLRDYCDVKGGPAADYTRLALRRSAWIAAVCCEALIRLGDTEGTAHRVLIAAEGSVIRRAPGYRECFLRELRALDTDAERIVLIETESAGLKGAALLFSL